MHGFVVIDFKLKKLEAVCAFQRQTWCASRERSSEEDNNMSQFLVFAVLHHTRIYEENLDAISGGQRKSFLFVAWSTSSASDFFVSQSRLFVWK